MANRNAGRRSEAERFRDAAELAIEQLDWCIDYLHRIRRPGIGQALRRNRNAIVKRHRL
ncbi:MAG TPA: hypothetical protein VF032_04685 [Thermoleophilaceae bacterium]